MATGKRNPGDMPNKPENNGPKSKGNHPNRPASGASASGAQSRKSSPAGGSQPQAEPPEAVVSAIDDVSDKAKEVMDRATDGLKQTTANAAVQVQQAQQVMLDRANNVKSKAASQLYQAAETLRSEIRTEQGQPVQQAEALARNLDQLGRYLEAHSFDEIESDARHTIQRNPWQSVGIAVAVGWVLSRIFAPRR